MHTLCWVYYTYMLEWCEIDDFAHQIEFIIDYVNKGKWILSCDIENGLYMLTVCSSVFDIMYTTYDGWRRIRRTWKIPQNSVVLLILVLCKQSNSGLVCSEVRELIIFDRAESQIRMHRLWWFNHTTTKEWDPLFCYNKIYFSTQSCFSLSHVSFRRRGFILHHACMLHGQPFLAYNICRIFSWLLLQKISLTDRRLARIWFVLQQPPLFFSPFFLTLSRSQ